MASSADILAGRAFVQLYVRDRLFRQQLAENEQLFQETFSNVQSEGARLSSDEYLDFAITADNAIEQIYNGTIYLTEATQDLNDALLDVMDTYMGLSEMQQEGITLNVGGPTGSGQTLLGVDSGEMMSQAASAVGGAPAKLIESITEGMGGKLGEQIIESNVVKGLLSKAGGMASGVVGGAAGAAGAAAGSAVAPGMVAAMGGAAAAAATAFSAMTIAAAAAVPILAAIDDEANGALSRSGLYPAWLKKIGDAMNFFTPLGAIVKTVSFTLQQLWSVIKLVGEALLNILMPVIIPLVAALKAMQLGMSLVMAGMRAWISVALLPLKAVLFALTIPLKLVKLAIDAILLPFTLAKKSCEYLVAAIKLIPSAAAAAWAGIQKLSSWSWSAAKSVGSAAASIVKSIGSMVKSAAAATVALGKMAWAGMVGSIRLVGDAINGIGSAIKRAGMGLAVVGGGIAALGAAVVGPLTAAASMFQEHGETVSRLAKGYKITAEEASVYSYAIGQMNRQVGEKGQGGFRMQENRMKDLVKTMKVGSAEFEAWRKQAEASGMVLGGPGVESALAMDDAMDRLRDSIKGLWVQLGSAVAPAIIEATELMAGFVRGVVSWVKENKPLIATTFQVAKVVVGVGTAIGAAGTALMALGSAISPLTAALAAIAGAMAIVEYRTGAARSLWDAYKGSVVSVYNTIVQYLRPVVKFVQEVIDGIYNAVKAGDLALAAQIAWSGFKIAWIDGLLWLSDRTSGTFQAILQNLSTGNWRAAADGAMGMIQAAFLRVQQTADDVWQSVLGYTDTLWIGMQNGFDIALGSIEKAWMTTWERMKVWGKEFLVWIKNNVFQPVANALAKYDPTGVAAGVALDATLMLANAASGISPLSKEDQARRAGEIDRQTADAISRRQNESAAYLEGQQLSADERRARRNAEIARQEARGGAGTAASEAARRSLEARLGLERSAAEAKQKMKETAQPPEPQLGGKGKSEGLVVSGVGAYAAQMIGSASTPQEKTVEELRLARMEKRAREKQFDQRWARLDKWLNDNNIVTPKKQPIWDTVA